MAHLQQATIRNRLLRALSPGDFALLQPHLQRMTTQIREELIAANMPVKEFYFPEVGIVSVTTATVSGEIEVGLIGREGLVGAAPVLLRTDQTPQRSFVQIAGEMLSIGATELRGAVRESPSLHDVLLRYIHT